MLKNKTTVQRNFGNIISGEWIAAENNASGATVNLVPEFPMDTPYRGNFQAIQTGNDKLNVLNTAHCEEDDEISGHSAGKLQLRWLKIIKLSDEEDKYIAQPREQTVLVPHLSDCSANSDGWLYLKMQRIQSGNADVTFSDDVLGEVKLKFALHCTADLPNDSKTYSILPLATVILDNNGEIEEIVQQQFGPGVLCVPIDIEDSSSSSTDEDSSSSSQSESISSSSSVSDIIKSDSRDSSSTIIDPPEDSSSSVSGDDIIVDVLLKYNETSIGDFMGMGVETHTTNVLLKGSFTAAAVYPANGYTVTMTGTANYDFGNGETNSEEISWEMNILQNTQRSCWDVYHQKINDWAGYYNEKNSEFDTDFSTPTYTFPTLQSMPSYPIGTICVVHHLIYGVSNNVPDNDLQSTLEITFTRK